MRLKPVRALTQEFFLVNSFISSIRSNEVKAREGIDTGIIQLAVAIIIASSNEVKAREGIDTVQGIVIRISRGIVAMRLKPVRALTLHIDLPFCARCAYVAMRLKPVRALTRFQYVSAGVYSAFQVAMRLKPVRALTPNFTQSTLIMLPQ